MGQRKDPAGSERRMPEIAIPVFGYKSHIALDGVTASFAVQL